MKKIALLMTVLSCAWLSLPAHAEEGSDKGQKPPKPGYSGGDGGPREKMRMRFMENLSPENQERFEAAREKAMQDPALQELRKAADRANRDFFKAVRDKMMEIDPGLSDIVKKNFNPSGKGPKKGDMPPPPNEAKGPDGKPKPEGKGWRGHKEGAALSGLSGMTEAERRQYMAARETAKNDPAVQAAEKKKKEAPTPEARQAAAEEYRQAVTAAIVKVDPSLAPLVEKMAPPEKPKSNPQSGPEGATMAPQMME